MLNRPAAPGAPPGVRRHAGKTAGSAAPTSGITGIAGTTVAPRILGRVGLKNRSLVAINKKVTAVAHGTR